jgi:hypothetical protein
MSGKPLHLDAAVCLRKFHWILLLRKLQDLHHLPDTGHSFGPPEHTDTLNLFKKGKFMNSFEKFYVNSETKRGKFPKNL